MALSISSQESSLSRRTAWTATVEAEARMRSLVNEHSDYVARTLWVAGVSQFDLDDEVQRTFIVAARRLADVRIGAERSFLYRVARNTAWHAHRARARRRETPSGDLPDVSYGGETFASPESIVQRRQLWTLLAGILDKLNESLRAVFVLCEIEGMGRGEIAAALKIPRGTVASRLRLARKEVRTRVAFEFASAGSE
jgi:RNA polymerase sigma-70 factor (ECF subfamily)